MILHLFLWIITICVILISLWGTYLLISSRCFLTAPTVASCGPSKQWILNEISKKLKNKKDLCIMDLGSGFGSILVPLAKKFPQHRFVGVERGYMPWKISLWRSRKLKNISFKREDLFQSDIHLADIIVVFLMPYMLKQLERKFKAEAKSGMLLFSNRFPLPVSRPIKRIYQNKMDQIYIYRF